MKSLICLLALMLSGVVADLTDECDMAGFYLELGCTALPTDNNAAICPESFKCPNFRPDSNTCYYKGVPFEDGSYVSEAKALLQVVDPCFRGCRCRMHEYPQFICPIVDCVESLDPNCLNTYDLRSCCSTNKICDENAIANLKTCEVDGVLYREGQPFYYFKNRKTMCICTKDWNGSIDKSYCREFDCGFQIHKQIHILKHCAPVFFGDMKGCPYDFQCQLSTSELIRGPNPRNVTSQCLFGSMILNVGDEVTVGDNCVRCFCNVPPFVACTKKSNCDN